MSSFSPPLLSVIIESTGPMDRLEQAIRSTLEQTHPALEIIIIHESHQQPYFLHQKRWSAKQTKKNSPRLRFFRTGPGLHPAAKRNAALEIAQGRYLLALDANEQLEANAAEILISALEQSPPETACAYANHRLHWMPEGLSYDQRGRRFLNKFRFLQHGEAHSPQLYRTEALHRVGGWPQGRGSTSSQADFEMCLRLLDAGYTFIWVDACLLHVTRHRHEFSPQHEQSHVYFMRHLQQDYLPKWRERNQHLDPRRFPLREHLYRILFLTGRSRTQVDMLGHALTHLGHGVQFVSLLDGSVRSQRRRIRESIERFRPHAIMTSGHLPESSKPAALLRSLHRFGILHAHWALDDATECEHIHAQAAGADLVFTPTIERLPDYQRLGVPAFLLHTAADPRAYRGLRSIAGADGRCILATHGDTLALISELPICGDPDPVMLDRNLQIIIQPLLRSGHRLVLWERSHRAAWWTGKLPASIDVRPMSDDESMEVFRSAKLLIGLHHTSPSNSFIERSAFEIPASRTVLLTAATPAFEDLFRSGEEILLSSDAEQTVSLVRRTLSNPGLAARIAAAGQRRVYLEHTYLHRAQQVVSILEMTLESVQGKWA